ncbi:MAG: hypothetical protein HKN20_17915, partial [Gemmatimonadetes bacterium]|nr:hypothetical protein [Gemmatimonadota bacterium]
IEDWLPNFNEVDPFIGVRVNLRDEDTGETSWHNDIFHNVSVPPILGGDLVWSGTSFSMNLDPAGDNRWTVRISGSTNANGTVLENLSYSKEYQSGDYLRFKWVIECTDLPFSWGTEDEYLNFSVSAPGTELQSHVSKLEYTRVEESPFGDHHWSIESVDWTADTKLLSVRFGIRE